MRTSKRYVTVTLKQKLLNNPTVIAYRLAWGGLSAMIRKQLLFLNEEIGRLTGEGTENT